MIDGFVGQVLPEHVIGWAFDRSQPDAHLLVEIYCGDRHFGSTSASLFRPDLAAGGIGSGDHGFLFRFPEALDSEELGTVVVRARSPSGSAGDRELPRFQIAERTSKVRTAPAVSPSTYHDDEQFPVFVLGAPRSGTSAVAQAIMATTPYQGHQEGQVIDLLNPVLTAVRRFYEAKDDEIVMPERITMIKKVPEEYITNGIYALFAEATRRLFPTRRWCDKTPTPEMIRAAPHLMRIWPKAKFIFVKRRALENVMSRMRKFRPFPFEMQCQYWTACMEAWLAIREQFAGRALELDQQFVAREPARAAAAIGGLLGLAATEVEDLGRVLARHRPERTGKDILDICDADTMEWSAQQWATFDLVCGATMTAYGYSRDRDYYRPGAEDRCCLLL